MPTLENLIRGVVAPELIKRGVYLIRAEEGPQELIGCSNWAAWTSPQLDIAYQAYLERAGRWQGRGIAIAFSEGFYLLDHNEQMGIVAHEIGHWACCPGAERDAPVSDAQCDSARRRLAFHMNVETRWQSSRCTCRHRPTPVNDQCDADGLHGADFCRAAYHAAFRFARCGERPDPDWLLGHTAMSFSQVEADCAIEAAERLTESLTSVASSPWPR